jgi:hypothetical protein
MSAGRFRYQNTMKTDASGWKMRPSHHVPVGDTTASQRRAASQHDLAQAIDACQASGQENIGVRAQLQMRSAPARNGRLACPEPVSTLLRCGHRPAQAIDMLQPVAVSEVN